MEPEIIVPAAAPAAPAAPAPVGVKATIAAARAALAANPQPDVDDEPWEAVQEESEALSEEEGEKWSAEDAAGQRYDLKLPEFVPLAEQTPERTALVDSFKAIAPEMGMGSQQAQEMLDCFVDVATQVGYDAPDEFATPEDAYSQMEACFGQQTGDALVRAAQRYVAGGPDNLGPWLTQTGLGNDVGVIATLALAEEGIFRLSAAGAQKELTRTMKSPDYLSGDKLTMVKVQVLSRIAGRERLSPTQMLNEFAATRSTPALKAPAATARFAHHAAAVDGGASLRADARKQVNEMIANRQHPLNQAGHPDHEAAVARYMALLLRM